MGAAPLLRAEEVGVGGDTPLGPGPDSTGALVIILSESDDDGGLSAAVTTTESGVPVLLSPDAGDRDRRGDAPATVLRPGETEDGVAALGLALRGLSEP